MKNIIERKVKSINEIKRTMSWCRDESGIIGIIKDDKKNIIWIIKNMMKKFGDENYYEFVEEADRYVCLDDNYFYLSEWFVEEDLNFGIEEYFEI
jgi:hypothetical protein